MWWCVDGSIVPTSSYYRYLMHKDEVQLHRYIRINFALAGGRCLRLRHNTLRNIQSLTPLRKRAKREIPKGLSAICMTQQMFRSVSSRSLQIKNS